MEEIKGPRMQLSPMPDNTYEEGRRRVMETLKTEINEFFFMRLPGGVTLDELEDMATDLFEVFEGRWDAYTPKEEAKDSQPEVEPMKKYEYQITKVCSDLHSVCTGAMDGISDKEINKQVNWLLFRIRVWTGPTSAWEATLLKLIRATLTETSEKLGVPKIG